MRIPIVIVALTLSSTAASRARLAAQTPTSPPSAPQSVIQTTGRAEARIAPDRATITIGVESRGATAAAAGADNAKKQRAILDTLRSLGLTSDLLSTQNYSVSPEMQYPQGGQPRVTGYTVSNVVRVEVHRLEDVPRIIDATLAKGANQIASLQFYSSKADSVRRVALAQAVANARADAEVLARAAGGSLGALLELSTEPNEVRPITVPIAMARMAAPAPTPIEPGEATISAFVSARWALQGAR
ncbi:MAG: SIMPL domain-containing protein [Gemmatimonadaceae bacterium]